ncbi:MULTISPECIES: SDR family oxidoreductase [unclassified Alteromonas]|uniref:SDR family oxidoreductase n=1 Tax=unclassified Alteromonas TaxID=2614992 RepID=UPI000509AF31|nr:MULTISPECIES: SDR family oxidoreductase [unclassified Alteromonas]
MAIAFEKQVCLLTGASGGIGEAIAKQLASLGVSLILTGRNTSKLGKLVEVLPGQHTVVCADLTQTDDMEKVVALCRDKSVTMLINNAGITETGSFTGGPQGAVDSVITTNLVVPITLTQKLIPILQRAPDARIVNIGSTFGSIGFACHSLYCASKFGLRGWTESLIREYAGTNLHFHYFAPRATQTSINSAQATSMNQALGNAMDNPSDVAQALVDMLYKKQCRRFLGFPEKLFVKINGAFPSLVDAALKKQLPTIQRYMKSRQEEKLS